LSGSRNSIGLLRRKIKSTHSEPNLEQVTVLFHKTNEIKFRLWTYIFPGLSMSQQKGKFDF